MYTCTQWYIFFLYSAFCLQWIFNGKSGVWVHICFSWFLFSSAPVNVFVFIWFFSYISYSVSLSQFINICIYMCYLCCCVAVVLHACALHTISFFQQQQKIDIHNNATNTLTTESNACYVMWTNQRMFDIYFFSCIFLSTCGVCYTLYTWAPSSFEWNGADWFDSYVD